jgi:sugar (pentulose or hexulose) kinase
MEKINQSTFLIFNLGFRSLRAMVFDQEGKVLFKGSRNVKTYQNSSEVEQRPIELINDVEELLIEISKDGDLTKKIDFITFTGSSTCLIGGDRNGEAITNCLLVSDRRADAQAAYILKLPQFKELKFYGRLECDATHMIPKILWVKQNFDEPEGGWRFYSPNDFICSYFTGKFITDIFNAQKVYYDIDSAQYPKSLLRELDIKTDSLPEVVNPGTIVGSLESSIRQKFKLSEKCKFIVTTYDAICGFWGSGPQNATEACHVYGTVTSLRVCSSREGEANVSKKLFFSPMDGSHGILGGSNNLGGGLVEWSKNQFLSSPAGTYYEIETLAEQSLHGARGLIFLPYLLGERAPIWNTNARGVFFGIERFHNK